MIENSIVTKDQTAQILADAHFQLDPDVTRIFRLVEPDEADSRKPVKLLEVNPSTLSDGMLPIAMSADPAHRIYYSVVIVEITPDELEQLQQGELQLPAGWALADELFPSKSAAGAAS